MIYMPVLSNAYYIPPDHEQWLVFHLERVKNDCISCARAVLDKTGLQVTETRMAQFVVLVLLQHVFGYSPSALHMTLRAPSFSKVRSWIAGLDGSYPGESTGYKRYQSNSNGCARCNPTRRGQNGAGEAHDDPRCTTGAHGSWRGLFSWRHGTERCPSCISRV